MPTIIAVWAIVWALVAAGIAVVGVRRGLPLWAAVWLVTIGAFLAAHEDPSCPPDGVHGAYRQLRSANITPSGGADLARVKEMTKGKEATRP